MQFQIASDIHIEMFRLKDQIAKKIPGNPLHKPDQGEDKDYLPLIKPVAPVLALIGDIGCPATQEEDYRFFLHSMADLFKYVLVVAGNHEYYVSSWKLDRGPMPTVEKLQQRIHAICAEKKKIFFLQKGVVDIEGVRFLGTTLWSDIPPKCEPQVSMALNDYRSCYVDGPNRTFKMIDGKTFEYPVRPLTTKDTITWFKSEKSWLEAELKKAHKEKLPVVVLTHHAPATKGTSHPRFDGSAINTAFSSDLSPMLSKYGSTIRYWCYGHTHYNPAALKSEGVPIVANQMGYIFEPASGEKYRNDYTITIEKGEEKEKKK